MAKRIEIDFRAEVEARKAFEWYEGKGKHVADRFQAAVDAGIAAIVRYPQAFGRYLHGTQRCLLKKFPYEIVFIEFEDHFFIVAIAHEKRAPGYWRKRLQRP